VFKYTFPTPEPEQEVARRPQRWHAVAIVTTDTACAAARACQNSRYLSVDAPRLPLAGCDTTTCDCTYRHFADRRQGARRGTSAPDPDTASVTERRDRRGRRADD
jgi:hypothetical protein